MKKHYLFLALFALCATHLYPQNKLTKYADPFIGTAANGHTFPGATLPFGMVQLSPDTDDRGWDWCSGYNSQDSSLMGFSHTHLSGTGAADYGDILVTATTGNPMLFPGSKTHPHNGYRSCFSHTGEKAEPGYYRVRLDDYGIVAELTATARTGFHKYTFEKAGKGNIILDLSHGISDETEESSIEIEDMKKITGFRLSNGWAKNQYVFFTIEFSKPFIKKIINDGSAAGSGNKRGDRACFIFNVKKDESILVKVGISAVDMKGAESNLKAENPGWDFESVKKTASDVWENELSKIKVYGKNDSDKVKFYTALYHTMIAPNIYSDVDNRYRGMDNKIHIATGYNHYTVFSLWDTFRAEHPLLTIIDSARTTDFIRTFLDDYEQSGLLPVWKLANWETNCMIGYHAAPVISDAIVKGIRNYDVEKAMKAMIKSAEQDSFGIKYYKKMGFVPVDKETDAVSRTAEYAYDDWCISMAATALNKTPEYQKYFIRSYNFLNLMDSASGFMRGRNSDGRWQNNFDPLLQSPLGGGDFTEGNSWQYSWFAPHKMSLLIGAMGGKEKFTRKLDSLFALKTPANYFRLQDLTGTIGQYAHGNEPGHHTIFLYNYVAEQEKTARWARYIMDNLYGTARAGICGNEDCGQMSAWYVFNAMGFYPMIPGMNRYVFGSSIFDSLVITTGKNKYFTLVNQNISDKNIVPNRDYPEKRPSYPPGIDWEELRSGKTLTLQYSQRAENPKDSAFFKDQAAVATRHLKYFKMVPKYIFPPYIESDVRCFARKTNITLSTYKKGLDITYTLDGSEPDATSPVYDSVLAVTPPCLLKARSFSTTDSSEAILEARFYKSIARDTTMPFFRSGDKIYPEIKLLQPYSSDYPAAGNDALIDGRRGSRKFNDHIWQAFFRNDLEAVVDLGKKTRIAKVSVGLLEEPGAWILFPQFIEYYGSDDGVNFKLINRTELPDTVSSEKSIKDFSTGSINFEARYIKVLAKNHPVLPQWHSAKGQGCHIFADEILIEPAD